MIRCPLARSRTGVEGETYLHSGVHEAICPGNINEAGVE